MTVYLFCQTEAKIMFKQLIVYGFNSELYDVYVAEIVTKRVSKIPKNCLECYRAIDYKEEYYEDKLFDFENRRRWNTHVICEKCWRGEKLSSEVKEVKYVLKSEAKREILQKIEWCKWHLKSFSSEYVLKFEHINKMKEEAEERLRRLEKLKVRFSL